MPERDPNRSEELAGVEPAGLVRVKDGIVDAPEDSEAFSAMHGRALDYVSRHHWCASVVESFLGFGVADVVAVFLFRVRMSTEEEQVLWVVVGDLPTAYLVTDEIPTAAVALEVYADLMDDWVDAVREGTSLEGVFPVAAPADEEHASMLESRTESLRTLIIPVAAQGVSFAR